MKVISKEIKLSTQGNSQTIDITDQVAEKIKDCSVQSGIVHVFVPGSTAGITTIEYESGVVRDLHDAIERSVPENMDYFHDQRWHDGNGHSHVRAAIIGPGLTVPFSNQTMILGTWQQIVVLDFDNRPRNRKIILQILGE